MSALLKWCVFCVVTGRAPRLDLDTRRYFEIGDREDLTYEEKLAAYRELADEYFEVDRYHDFCASRLAARRRARARLGQLGRLRPPAARHRPRDLPGARARALPRPLPRARRPVGERARRDRDVRRLGGEQRGGRRDGLADDGERGGHDGRVELRARAAPQLGDRHVGAASRPRYERSVVIALKASQTAHDARLERDRAAGQAVGVAAAVPPLVGRAHDPADVAHDAADAVEHPLALDRVRLA